MCSILQLLRAPLLWVARPCSVRVRLSDDDVFVARIIMLLLLPSAEAAATKYPALALGLRGWNTGLRAAATRAA